MNHTNDAAPERSRVSRRHFLRGVGVAAAAGAATKLSAGPVQAAPAPLVVQDELKVTGAGTSTIKLKINGAERAVSVEPRVTLLDALRERLDLTGAKKICDRGSCGGCTVLVNGKPMNSCMLLAVECVGDSIETIEGLAPEGEFSAVSRALAECDGLQCGFCTPGFVMTVTHHLRNEKAPTLETVKEACRGNLCRCGTYTKVYEAALLAAARATPGAPKGGK